MTWVLITGATGGIGRHAALTLARAGLRVIATGRDGEKLRRVGEEARGAVRTVALDVCDAESVDRARERVHELTGGHGIDVLVNNAGYGEMGPIEQLPVERVRAMFETNVVGLARVTRAFVPAMRARGRGRVINVSSLLGRMTLAAHGAYGATKHALEALSDSLRMEMAPFGVSVSVVEPGSIDTGFSELAFGALDSVRGDPEWERIAARVRKLEPFNQRASAKPEAVSQVLLELATHPAPPARVVVPRAAAAQLWAARLAPRPFYEAVIRGAMGFRASQALGSSVRGERLALITGAAGGIGSATALRLAKAGISVLATDRDELALAGLVRDAREARLPIESQPMDVSDDASIARVAALVTERTAGRGLDVLVNNAGYAELGPIELAGDEAWRAQLAVNVYGLLRVTRVFSPAMRHRGAGRILNVSSIAGIVAFPFMGLYCASKFAVEALTDAMRLELGAFGVEVSAVQPAFIRSGFAARAASTVERYELGTGPYAPIADRMDAIMSKLDALGGEPEDVARAILRAVRSPAPHARYRAPFSAKLAAALAPWVPSELEDRGLARLFEMHRLVPSASGAQEPRSASGGRSVRAKP